MQYKSYEALMVLFEKSVKRIHVLKIICVIGVALLVLSACNREEATNPKNNALSNRETIGQSIPVQVDIHFAGLVTGVFFDDEVYFRAKIPSEVPFAGPAERFKTNLTSGTHELKVAWSKEYAIDKDHPQNIDSIHIEIPEVDTFYISIAQDMSKDSLIVKTSKKPFLYY